MNALKMKIVAFDAISGTLQIKFAADTAFKSIDEYPTHDFNVKIENDTVTIDDILKALAQTGWAAAFQQEVAEQTAKDNEAVKMYTNLVGKEFDFTSEALFALPPTCPSEKQPTVSGAVII
jgi:hypothetical protein